MAGKKNETWCPWCDEVMLKTEAETKSKQNDYGSVTEKRCNKCGKILAAYLKGAGDFLPKIRTFQSGKELK